MAGCCGRRPETGEDDGCKTGKNYSTWFYWVAGALLIIAVYYLVNGSV